MYVGRDRDLAAAKTQIKPVLTKELAGVDGIEERDDITEQVLKEEFASTKTPVETLYYWPETRPIQEYR